MDKDLADPQAAQCGASPGASSSAPRCSPEGKQSVHRPLQQYGHGSKPRWHKLIVGRKAHTVHPADTQLGRKGRALTPAPGIRAHMALRGRRSHTGWPTHSRERPAHSQAAGESSRLRLGQRCTQAATRWRSSGAPSGSPVWMQGWSSTDFPGTLAESWIGSGTTRTQTGTPLGIQCVTGYRLTPAPHGRLLPFLPTSCTNS